MGISECDLHKIKDLDGINHLDLLHKDLDNEIDDLNEKLEGIDAAVAASKAAADPINEEIARIEGEAQILRDIKAGSEKTLNDLKAAIAALEEELRRGSKDSGAARAGPGQSFLQSSGRS